MNLKSGFLRATAASLLLMCLTGVSQAHHSTANFDRSKTQTITGTVKYFGFTNPHSFLDVDVTDPAMKPGAYKVFATGKVLLLRYDWKTGDVKAGDKITVSGYPDKQDPHFMYLTKIIFASGKVWERTNIPD